MLRRVLGIGLIIWMFFPVCVSHVAQADPPQFSSTASATNQPSAPGAQPSPTLKQPHGNSPSKSNSQAPVPAAQASPTRLPDVAITATRITTPLSDIGVTTTVVTNQQIQDQKIQETSDALREVPGVVVTQSGGQGTVTEVSIRGSSTDQVLTLLDGVEVNNGGSGSFDFANLTTDNASRIEVIRGAGGSLYGSSAIGGVINQISQEGMGSPKFTLLSDGGNWETQRQVATVNGAEGRLGYSGSVSYYSTGGFQSVNGQSDNLSLTSRLDYHLTNDTVLRGFARYTFADVGLPEFSNTDPGAPLDPTAHQRTEFMLYKGEVESRVTDKLIVRGFGSFVRDEIRLNKVPSPGLPNSETDDIPDEIWGSNLEAIYTWFAGFDTLAGFDFKYRWERDGDDSTFPPSPPSITVFAVHREEYAGYLQQQGRFFHDHLLVTGGFRVDGNSQFGKEVSPAWSVALPFDQYGIILRGNYSEGFEAPTFDELYFPGFGNPNLQATTSSEWDGGIEKRFGELAGITTTYFSRRIHDLVVDVPCTPTPSSCEFGLEPENIGRADMQGVEVVPSVYPFKGLSLSGNFTVLDSTHRPLVSGLQPIRVPKYSASAVAQYKVHDLLSHDDQFTSALFYQFVGDREDIQTQAPFGDENHGSYQLFNLTLSYKLADGLVPYLSREEAFVRIQNLFDRNYSQAFGFPSPPINFEAGLKIGFTP
jgi:vitamin B12 transporter